MAQVDGSIVIDTAIRADGFKEGARELEVAVRRMASTVKDIGTKAKTALNKQVDAFSKLNGEYAAQSKKVDELKKKVAEYGNQKIPTDEYSGLQKQLDKLSAKYDEVDAKKREWENFGFSEKDSLAMKELSTQLENISQEMGEIIAKQEQLEASGTAFKDPLKTKEAIADMEKLEAAVRKLDDMRNRLNTFYSSIKGTVADLGGSVADTEGYMNLLQSTLNGLLMAGRGAVYILKSVSGKMINSRNGIDILRDAFGKLDSTIKKVFSTMLRFTGRTVLAGLKKLANGIFAIHKSANKTSEGVKFSVSMGKIFFDKNKICIIVLSKFLVFCCRIIYLIIVLPIRLRLYLNFKIFCSTNNGISNPFSWALPTPGLGNKLGFSGNTINAEGIR